MKKKKQYTTPQVKSEKIKIGVFGDYGSVPRLYGKKKKRRKH